MIDVLAAVWCADDGDVSGYKKAGDAGIFFLHYVRVSARERTDMIEANPI